MPCEFWLTTRPGRFASVGYSGNLNLYDALRWSASVTDVANELLRASAGRRFAELATDGPSPSFDTIIADSKISASLRPRAESGSADSFLSADPPAGGYDVIVIDWRHEPRHCLEVIERCLFKLSADGVLVVQYSNPPSAWHQRPAAEAGSGSEWTGQVWRAVVEFRMRHPHCEVFTVDTDWGCTVIRPSRHSRHRLGTGADHDLDWNTFVHKRSNLLELVSVPWFRRYLYADPYIAGSASFLSTVQLLNALIAVQGLDTCLYLGDSVEQDLSQIIAPVRQSVASSSEATFRMQPHEFYSSSVGLGRYDLIVIGALDIEGQGVSDWENALGRLSDSGWLVVPHIENAAEALIRFVDRHSKLSLHIIALDVSCAVIRRRTEGARTFNAVEDPTEWLRSLVGHAPEQGNAHMHGGRAEDHEFNLVPQQYINDRALLLDEVVRNPNDVRSTFYLAQSYFAANDFVNARKWYTQQLKLRKPWWPNLDEQYYVAMYRLAASMAHLGEPWQDIREAYLDALEFRPTRAEAAYAIAFHYRANKRFRLGYAFAKLAAEIPLPEQDTLCIRTDVHSYLATDEQAVCAFWLGKHAESFTLCRRLLAQPGIPDTHRQRIAVNRDYSAATMIEAAALYPAEPVCGLVSASRDAEVTVTLSTGADHQGVMPTLNSFMHCCKDFARIGRFVILDSGLTVRDREALLDRYGFLEFVDCQPDVHLAWIRQQVGGRYWLHLGSGWRFFAPENLITRLIAVLKAEPGVYQVGVNFADATRLTGTCAAEASVHRAPDAGRYVRTDVMTNGPAMFDTERLDRAETAGLGTASLDEVLCVAEI